MLSIRHAIKRSWVQLPVRMQLHSDYGQAVHTHVPLSSSSIIGYRSMGRDALQLGRKL